MEKETQELKWTSINDKPVPTNFDGDIAIVIDNQYIIYCFWRKDKNCLDYQYDSGDAYDTYHPVPIDRITHYLLLPEIPNKK